MEGEISSGVLNPIITSVSSICVMMYFVLYGSPVPDMLLGHSATWPGSLHPHDIPASQC